MNKETFEALKSIMDIIRYYREQSEIESGEVFTIAENVNIKRVENWIDEVAKEKGGEQE